VAAGVDEVAVVPKIEDAVGLPAAGLKLGDRLKSELALLPAPPVRVDT
jgi:hypothetical protein